MEAFAAGIEASAIGTFVRESSWAYPAANLAHLLGMVLLVGGIGLVDLRLIGLFRSLPLDPTVRALTPPAIGGLLLMLVSGPLLFAADARSLVRSDYFVWKLVLIAIALANALIFRRLWQGGEPTSGLRLMALLSVAAWLLVAAFGRLIAYA